ncbi:type II secretion system major pseudopilin GspG [Thermodesulfovibrionales bacterium]|nr:type II secretion system major pseudopilin GspG [Thermodesulfovibrionales bacterium]
MCYVKNKKGFTLIELMVVVVILGILAVFIMPAILDRPDEARVIKAQSDIRAIESALKMFRLDNGFFPTTEQGLMALIEKPDIPPIPPRFRSRGYLDHETEPLDPWNNRFIYRSPAGGDREFEIISLGADREKGGEGVNADINNWEIR